MRFFKGQMGSAATEYMLVVSVITVGVTAAGYAYVPGFKEGTAALSRDVSSILATGDVGEIGMGRHGGQNANGGAAPGAPTTPGTSNPAQPCTGSYIAFCTGQTAGIGGGAGDPTTGSGVALAGQATGASNTSVATLQDPNAAFGERIDAMIDVLDNTTQNCGQVFLAGETGESIFTVTLATVTQGLTVPDTMKINLPFLGISMGNIPTDYKGYMSLAQMQTYLTTKGVTSTVSQNVTTTQIDAALKAGQKVGVILDVDANWNPAPCARGAGGCGHTVKVLSINTSANTVTLKDRYGTRDVPLQDFQNSLSAQGGGMIAVTPKSHGGGWASNTNP